MTSNEAPAPGAPAGRRRALGRGPTAPPREAGTEPATPTNEPEAPAPQRRTPEREPEAPAPQAPTPEREPEAPAPQPATPEREPEMPAPQPSTPEREPEAAGAGPEASGPATVAGGAAQDAPDGVFTVRLANFEGPFDLLLQLISKHKLDVTEVALSKVTDEFMAHIRAMGPDWDLDQTTEFLVVAATLLDLKAARLLPAAEVEDEADLALLEARDLLFARLLQYRAYKQIADIFDRRLDDEARRFPRTVGLEPEHAELLPEVVISIGPEGFARLAVKAMQPRPKPQVYVDHIHAPLVSVQEQAGLVVARLRELGEASFRVLIEDTEDTLTVVARFLALLELYREKAVALDQETALGELTVRWTGGDADTAPRVTDEFDRPPERRVEEKKA
ncbi:segregation/condensation protein A [Streptomyces sp. SID486]|uniref:segregation and condensation protein A n=1 Tax=Streptomyces sp. SID486 TaxID=2690264 RepID=UPI00136C86AB|nr:segregation/condensation protein A [Streptomyces sp. SID486]MYX94710.1 segregation/condensation protein A [Streptomyces sp. SID486]